MHILLLTLYFMNIKRCGTSNHLMTHDALMLKELWLAVTQQLTSACFMIDIDKKKYMPHDCH